MTYSTLEDAQLAARLDVEKLYALAERGPGHVMVAEIRNVDGAFELVAVAIEPEGTAGSAPNRYVVKRTESLTCPVCWADGSEVAGEVVKMPSR